MNLNDPTGRLYQSGGQYPRPYNGPPPPRPFNSNIPPPGFIGHWSGNRVPVPTGPPSDLPPRLQLQMLLRIPPIGNHPPPPHRPPFPQPMMHNQPMYQNSRFGFATGNTSSIPGLGDSKELEQLRAIETSFKAATSGSWQAPGVTPPPLMAQSIVQDTNARQAEAFLRELQARGQFHRFYDDSGKRRHRSGSSSSDEDSQKKRWRQDDSDLEEGEVQEETIVPAPSFYQHRPFDVTSNMPPPLFGQQDFYNHQLLHHHQHLHHPQQPQQQQQQQQQHHQQQNLGSHIAPLLMPDEEARIRERDKDRENEKNRERRDRRTKNYRDLDAQEEGIDEASTSTEEKADRNSFDKLFSAYLSHKAKNSKEKEEVTCSASARKLEIPPTPVRLPIPESTSGIPNADILKSMYPDLQRALTAVGITVGSNPSSKFAQNPSLSSALSAFDRDIAQLGPQVETEEVIKSGSTLPANVQVEVADDTSEWANAAKEITSHVGKPGDQISVNGNLPPEIHYGRDNRRVVEAVQQFLPLIPIVEREEITRRLMESGNDKTNVPMLLPKIVVEEKVFPPMKMSSKKKNNGKWSKGEKGNGWSKSELHAKLKQARERVSHLKIEQAMVEERCHVMNEELRKLHRYFEINYSVKLVSQHDLTDPPELTSLAKLREADRKRTGGNNTAGNEDDDGQTSSKVGTLELPSASRNSDTEANELTDENGPHALDLEDDSADNDEIHLASSERLLKDRSESNERSSGKRIRSNDKRKKKNRKKKQ